MKLPRQLKDEPVQRWTGTRLREFTEPAVYVTYSDGDEVKWLFLVGIDWPGPPQVLQRGSAENVLPKPKTTSRADVKAEVADRKFGSREIRSSCLFLFNGRRLGKAFKISSFQCLLT